ncbi:uncharacterized protein N7483_005714 [Penicillium malachiteum]|uniref:uncharacterized protein n=1 Tax=Penicillium malachiteum TaxID=1324776 RepID=UPI0025499001|nr:uncharacterized protein N7483_005714 [Penicillium malachiteum]KAJ5731206.1 hypothetical protein N7483_005714 [Penicillium malachiteum]
MSSLPTVVLVHGAWHTPANYQTYVDALKKRGFQVHCPQLPTCTGIPPPTGSLVEDIACVKSLVTSLVDDGQRVLMILHSYGGAVGGSAVEGLSIPEREAAGKLGGVIHLLYLCAYMVPTGVSAGDIIREAKFEEILKENLDISPDGLTALKDPGLAFFSGRADQATVEKALKSLVRFPNQALYDPTTGCAWKTIPATYIRTLQDYAVPPIYQEIILGKVKYAGIEVKVETFDADHSLFITEQEEMVQAAMNAATDERNSAGSY